MTGSRPWIGWRICWKYISPIALFLILVATVYDLTEDTAKYQAFVGCEQVFSLFLNVFIERRHDSVRFANTFKKQHVPRKTFSY